MEIKCDLILLSWNNLAILKRCVGSLMRCTGVPSRLIIVDNGSTEEGLREYLSSLKDGPNVRLEVIFSSTNEGFSRGMNKGSAFPSRTSPGQGTAPLQLHTHDQ